MLRRALRCAAMQELRGLQPLPSTRPKSAARLSGRPGRPCVRLACLEGRVACLESSLACVYECPAERSMRFNDVEPLAARLWARLACLCDGRAERSERFNDVEPPAAVLDEGRERREDLERPREGGRGSHSCADLTLAPPKGEIPGLSPSSGLPVSFLRVAGSEGYCNVPGRQDAGTAGRRATT